MSFVFGTLFTILISFFVWQISLKLWLRLENRSRITQKWNNNWKTRTLTCEPCHGKTCLKILSLLYPKKDWRVGSHQSFFGYDTDCTYVHCCLHRLYSVVGVTPKEGLAGKGKDLKACFPMTLFMCTWDSYNCVGAIYNYVDFLLKIYV